MSVAISVDDVVSARTLTTEATEVLARNCSVPFLLFYQWGTGVGSPSVYVLLLLVNE